MNEEKRRVITHEEIRVALDKFRRNGGVITKLPDEEHTPWALVGHRWIIYDIDAEDIPILDYIQREVTPE